MSKIEDYALLGDLHTAALVSRSGSVDWLCLPRFDSPACFAALLDSPDAGRWLLAPASGGACTRRSYRDGALVLESEWDTPDGQVRVTDFMPARTRGLDLVRIVEGLSGAVPDARGAEAAVRPGAGRAVGAPSRPAGGGGGRPRRRLAAQPGAHAWGATTPRSASSPSAAANRCPFVLTWRPSHQPPPAPLDPARALEETLEFWRGWLARGRTAGRWQREVQQSLVVLKALTYAPTGGIVAAATTSLPEQLGGPRNWDYRYCWLRDAA